MYEANQLVQLKQLLNRIISTANDVLTNIKEAGAHIDKETGEEYQDIKKFSEALNDAMSFETDAVQDDRIETVVEMLNHLLLDVNVDDDGNTLFCREANAPQRLTVIRNLLITGGAL